MTRLILCTLMLTGFAAANLPAQNLAPAGVTAKAKPARKPSGKTKGKEAGKAQPPGGPAEVEEAITTEIYADQAFFDSPNSIGVFTGHVIVKDPRFDVQSDKLTMYLAKGSKTKGANNQKLPDAQPTPPPSLEQGLEKAVAEGNVGVVRETPGEDGAPPTRAIGRADMAIYTTVDGNVELRGSPRVQSGMNTHVATSPDTVMIITQDGKLTTHGPSRTEIRQEPSPSPTPKPAESPKPAETAKP